MFFRSEKLSSDDFYYLFKSKLSISYKTEKNQMKISDDRDRTHFNRTILPCKGRRILVRMSSRFQHRSKNPFDNLHRTFSGAIS